MSSIAIIGAGLSALTLARKLGTEHQVTLYEKSAKPGGRMTSREVNQTSFDHGAQFFIVRSKSFAEFLTPMIEAGVVADWQARFVELDDETILSERQWNSDFPHYVGYPNMAAVGRYLADGLNIHYDTHIDNIQRVGSQWQLSSQAGAIEHSYDWVITAIPVKQAAELLAGKASFAERLANIDMLPCYALMVALSSPPAMPFDAALIKNTNLSWMTASHSKPGREGFGIQAHASNAWAAENLDMPLEQVTEALLATVVRLSGIDADTITSTDIKRWHYANIKKYNGEAYFIDETMQLGACGDWCIAGRVEAAFSSATKLAEAIQSI
jgi:predicted NAD/FAD-dependent oxidoreductase